MEKYTEETVTTEENDAKPSAKTSTKREATGLQTVGYLIYFTFGVLEILLAFRLVLKLMGASLASNFVSSIYNITRVFIWPFEGIFHRGINPGVETASIFEPATLVAIIVYSLVAWGIVKLIMIFSGEKQES